MKIFLDDEDYRKFTYILSDVVEESGVECWNYCLMPNHYHLTLRPRRANLSDVLRRMNSRYAQWWNHRHDRVGHVFQGRFKDQIVQQEGYLPRLCRYVALNPVRAGLTARPEDWQWSSYAATLGFCSAPTFLSPGLVLAQFGDGDVRARRNEFVKYVLGEADESVEDRIRSSERILGDFPFKRMVGGDGSDVIDRLS